MRKWMIVFGCAMLMLVPLAVIAQDESGDNKSDDAVELTFTENGASVGVKDTISSIAHVSIELEGKQYLLKIPITVDLDATVPLSESLVTADSRTHVGGLAFEMVDMVEADDEIEVMVPGWSGEEEEELEPGSEGNKLVIIEFLTTNVGREEDELSSYSVKGVDDTGRLFDETELFCERMNPGETGRCVIVFDVNEDINIVALDLELTDNRQIPVPRGTSTSTPDTDETP